MVAQGYAAKVGIGAASPVTIPLEFVSCSMSKTSDLVLSNGIRGVRYRDENRKKIQRERCSGSLVVEPSITELDALLVWMMGSTAVGVTSFTDALVQRYVSVDKVTKVYTYDEVVPARWTLEGNEGQALRLSLELEGKSETEANAGTFPAITPDTDDTFFVFSEVTLTINSITCTPKSFRLSVDNSLDTERFLNALTRDDIPAQDRTANLEVRLPFDTVHEPLYDLAATGVAGSMVINDGSTSYTFAFNNLALPEQPIEVQGRSEIELSLNFQVFGDTDAGDAEFTVTKA